MNTERKIRPFEINDISAISPLFPQEWNFDFKAFISTFINKSFFKGYTLLNEEDIIGFGNIILFGDKAWLGNIVVSEQYRNKGLGTFITKHLIDQGKTLGVNTFNLFATQLGEPVYTKLGFKTCEYYNFYAPSKSQSSYKCDGIIKKASNDDFQNIIELDKKINAEERSEFLQMFQDSMYITKNSSNKLNGFYASGIGTGLIIAENETAGIDLLKWKINNNPGNVVVPVSNKLCNQFLTENKFINTLVAPRMFLGENYGWSPEKIYSRATGYCG